ncbi:MAG TPA: hypothetical protein VM223_00070 [Planctomycetota bacterium]|nr:hypothetical protein [Planctomycetota bacterium]
MNDKRRTEIDERLAAVPPIRPAITTYPGSASVKCITSRTQAADLRAFIEHAPADIRDLLADNAALEAELARVLEALGKLEPDYVASDEDGDYCEWCGGDSGHIDDCVFAVIAKDGEEN